MGTSSQFRDGVHLNILPTLSLRDTASELDSKETFVKAWSSLFTNFVRLTLSQYGRAFDLPHFIAIY